MKKVTITTRAVYHKVASVTIDVPLDIDQDKIQTWLWENEHLFVDELDEKLSEAPFDYGFGLDANNGMDDASSESETRFDFVEDNEITFGGHI